MSATEQALISFFILAAQKEQSLIRRLEENPSFILTPQQWSFTLPSLFTFLQSNEYVFSRLNYKDFKQLIYNSPINRSVKVYFAEIIIDDNQCKVDHSIYSLLWQKIK